MDKEAIVRRADTQEPSPPIAALLRDPYVLEFAGLAERPSYSEADLESALLDHLQAFLLELGTGFCFEARQKRITLGKHYSLQRPRSDQSRVCYCGSRQSTLCLTLPGRAAFCRGAQGIHPAGS
jgi:hypothetical protein